MTDQKDICSICGLDEKTLGVYRDYIHYSRLYPGKKIWCVPLSKEMEELIDKMVKRITKTMEKTIKEKNFI